MPIDFRWSSTIDAELGDQRRHVHAAGLEVTAARVEHGLHFLDQEGHVAALAEHGGHDAGQRHDPLEVLHATWS